MPTKNTTQAGSKGDGLKASNVNTFYTVTHAKRNPKQTPKNTVKTTTWQTLCASVRAGANTPTNEADVDTWLEQFNSLDDEGQRVIIAHRDAYCKVHDLTLVGVLCSHGGLEGAYLCGHASLKATSALAALYARTQEKGGAQ